MIKVGCCGYPTSMKKYYEKFQLVEINRTFYEYPKMSTVAGWQEKAPSDFEFTVKAYQGISHRFQFELEPSIKAFEQMKEICKTLKARILLIQTPGSLRPDKLGDAEKFFKKISREGLVVVWETRGPAWETPSIRMKLAEALKELDVPHVTDPFRAMPVYTSDVAYFRLHGLGKRLYYYQYTDKELKRLHGLVKLLEAEGKEVYVLFNNLPMFDDGIRFMHFIETGKFLSLTGAVGLESVERVIQKTRYPTTKSLLSKRIGWRLVELEEGRQTRLDELLKSLPSKSYESKEEVMQELRKLL
jgi:uncharacterized protein YecE (DUF72 family)